MTSLKHKTIFITGASRGIGQAIALRCAADGANLVIAAKSSEPHPKLAGTIHSVAREVEAAGGQALPLQLDVRDARAVRKAMKAAAEHFGGIDAVINNAGAISLTSVAQTSVARYDLMQQVNSRAVYLCSHYALPYLRESDNPHILSLSPPISDNTQWLGQHAPYTLSKYGMTLLSAGMAQELAADSIAVNTLWPKTIIATAAIEFVLGGKERFKTCRKPEIMADAAYQILTSPSDSFSGHHLIDEPFLASRGVEDFAKYAFDPEYADNLEPDLFID